MLIFLLFVIVLGIAVPSVITYMFYSKKLFFHKKKFHVFLNKINYKYFKSSVECKSLKVIQLIEISDILIAELNKNIEFDSLQFNEVTADLNKILFLKHSLVKAVEEYERVISSFIFRLLKFYLVKRI